MVSDGLRDVHFGQTYLPTLTAIRTALPLKPSIDRPSCCVVALFCILRFVDIYIDIRKYTHGVDLAVDALLAGASFVRPRRLSMEVGSETQRALTQELLGIGRTAERCMGEEEADREVCPCSQAVLVSDPFYLLYFACIPANARLVFPSQALLFLLR